MKLLLVTPYPSAGCDPQGGVEVSSQTLARALSSLDGLDVHVLCLDRVGVEESSSDLGVRVERVPYVEKAGWLNSFPHARRIVTDVVQRLEPDVVHGMGAGAEGVAVASLSGVPRVVTPHGDVVRDAALNRPRRLLTAVEGHMRGRIARQALACCDAVVAVGDPAANMASFGSRVVGIPNGVRPEFLQQPAAEPPRHGVFVPAAVKRIKGIERVLGAVAGLQAERAVRLPVRIAGRVEDHGYLDELMARAARDRVDVRWLGPLSAGRMAEEYDRAAVMVLASDWEVAPVSVVEALCRRCSVVAPAVPGLAALVGGIPTVRLWTPGEVDSLRACMDAALRDQDGAGRSADEARAWACEIFDAGSVARRHAALYEQLMAVRSSGDR